MKKNSSSANRENLGVDRKDIKKDAATIREDLKSFKEEFVIYKVDIKSEFYKLDEKNREYRDQVLVGLDKVMKELQDIREENATGMLQTNRTKEQLNDHEKRITKLESTKPIAAD